MKEAEIQRRFSDLEKRLEKLELSSAVANGTEPKNATNRKNELSINEFLRTKKLDDDVKRTLAIAYYLSYFGDPDSLTAEEIRTGFRLAKQPIPKNVNDKINLNVKNGHLAEERVKKNGKKNWYVTNSGAEFIEDKIKK